MKTLRAVRTMVVMIATALLCATGLMSAAAAPPSDEWEIATLPPVAHYPILVKGRLVVTDARGIARFVLPPGPQLVADDYTVAPAERAVNGSRVRYEPTKVQGAGGRRILFNVFYETSFDYANSNGGALDAAEIRDLTVKSSVGEVVTLPAHKPAWLLGKRVVPLAGRMVIKDLYWTVQDVKYEGTSVVNASQQRFIPAETQQVTVSLLFYAANLRVYDALFGFSHSGTVDLVYPNKRTVTLELDSDGRVSIPSLPRGTYDVVLKAGGPRIVQPVAISRDQDLDLKYYGWLDIAVVGGVVTFLSVGLLVIGARRRGRLRGR